MACGLTALVASRKVLSLSHYLGSIVAPIFGDVFLKRNEIAYKHNTNEFLRYVLEKRTVEAQLEENQQLLDQNELVLFKKNFPG